MARSLLGGLAQVGAGYLTGRTEEQRRREEQRRQQMLDALNMAQVGSSLQTAGLQRRQVQQQMEGYTPPADMTRLQHDLTMQRQRAGWERESALAKQARERARQMAEAQLRQRYGATPPHAQPPGVTLEDLAMQQPARTLEMPVRPRPSEAESQPTVGRYPAGALTERERTTGAPRMTLPRGIEGSAWQEQMREQGVEVPPWEEWPLEDLMALYGEAGGPVRFDALLGPIPGGPLPSPREQRLMQMEEQAAGLDLEGAQAELDSVRMANQKQEIMLERLPEDIAHTDVMRVMDEQMAEVNLRAKELDLALRQATDPLAIQEAQLQLKAALLKHDEALLRNKAFKDMLGSDDPETRRRAMDTLLGIQHYVSDVTPSKANLDTLLEQLRTEQARLHSDRRVTVDQEYSGIPTERRSRSDIYHYPGGEGEAPPEGAAPEGDEDPLAGRSPRSQGKSALELW